MLKTILNLDGARELSRKDLLSVNGGKRQCVYDQPNQGCATNECCSNGICYPVQTPGHPCTSIPF